MNERRELGVLAFGLRDLYQLGPVPEPTSIWVGRHRWSLCRFHAYFCELRTRNDG